MYSDEYVESMNLNGYSSNAELMEDISWVLDVMIHAVEKEEGIESNEYMSEKFLFQDKNTHSLVKKVSEHIEKRLENTLFAGNLHLMKLRQQERMNDYQLLCILIAATADCKQWNKKKRAQITPGYVLKLYGLNYNVTRETYILAAESMTKIEKYFEKESIYQKKEIPMERVLTIKPEIRAYLWGHRIPSKDYWLQLYQNTEKPESFIGFEAVYQRALTLAEGERMPHIVLCGEYGSGKKHLVKCMTYRRRKNIIFLDYHSVCQNDDVEYVEELCVDAFLTDADICICNCRLNGQLQEEAQDILLGQEKIERLLKAAGQKRIVVYLLSEYITGRIRTEEISWVKLVIKEPDIRTKIQLWNHFLTKYTTENIEPEILSNRYLLRAGEIKQILEQANHIAYSRRQKAIAMCDIVEAVKLRNGAALGNYAELLETNIQWNDLVVKEDVRTQLEYISDRLKYKNTVEAEWGFEEKVSYGKGICVLFYGPPGTGKTMAVKALANELGLELYRIDISRMVSKYIGETQKHITELFERAKHLNALLFFDEADAFFSKRTNVSDSNDRNANSEVAHLLQKLEEYDGISILATNLKDNIDDAFKRRIKYMIHFRLPDVETRKELWRKILPEKAPVSDNLELDYFAEQFEMSGSEIKDALLQAAFMAARDNEKISNQYIAQAIKLSFQKYGKILNDEDFGYLL